VIYKKVKETDMHRLWQKRAWKVDAILEMVDSCKSQMSTESFQNAVQGFDAMPCRDLMGGGA
jgi:hypothetical protein